MKIDVETATASRRGTEWIITKGTEFLEAKSRIVWVHWERYPENRYETITKSPHKSFSLSAPAIWW
jgi:hypothetical protein